jgi:hypothetical protein
MADPAVVPDDVLPRLSQALGELIALLSKEGLEQDFPSLDAAYRLSLSLASLSATVLPVDVVAELKSLTLSPFAGGVGSLSDLVIWRPSESDRIQINEQLSMLRATAKALARELPSG